MTVFVWRLLSCISAGVFAAVAIALGCMKLLKNKYYHSYEDNELIKNEQTSNSYNSLYFTQGETKKYIKKYVICKTLYDKFLVCNFAKRFSSIVYYVLEYSRFKRPIGVLRIEQNGAVGDSSKIITLSRRCAYVNVVAGTVDGKVINTDVIRPISASKIRLYSFLKAVLLFVGLFAARQGIVEIIAGATYVKQYLINFLNYIAVGASFALAFIGYFITVKCFRGKNIKEASGGALEYDFL